MVERYMELHEKYLADGRRLLAEGDYPQASEKYWGAVATLVKAIAEKRGWRHHSHRDLLVALGKIAVEQADVEMMSQASNAVALHANFYENHALQDWVRAQVQQVEALTEKLQLLADAHVPSAGQENTHA